MSSPQVSCVVVPSLRREAFQPGNGPGARASHQREPLLVTSPPHMASETPLDAKFVHKPPRTEPGIDKLKEVTAPKKRISGDRRRALKTQPCDRLTQRGRPAMLRRNVPTQRARRLPIQTEKRNYTVIHPRCILRKTVRWQMIL